MAIAFDTAQNNSFSNSFAFGGSYTFNHTCTGSDRFLIVSTGIGLGTSPSVTGVTYNGVSMTYIDGYATAPAALSESKLFVLANPASGTNVVSVQTSGSGSGYMYVASASYTGVDQTTPTPHNAKAQNTGATSLTLNINTSNSPSTDNCWFVLGGVTDGNYTASAGAGTTKRTSGTLTNWNNFYDNNGPITPAGADSLIVNMSSAANQGINLIGVSLAPAGGGGGPTANNGLMMFF